MPKQTLTHTHTHTNLVNTGNDGVLPLFLFCLYSNIFATPLICFVHVWQNGGLFPTGDPIVPFVIMSPVWMPKQTHTHPPTHTHTHTQTCKHRQTGVLPLFLFCLYSNIFATPLICFVHVWQTGAFFQLGPYCSFCYKSPVWMPKQTHTHTHTHSRLWPNPPRTSFVLSFVPVLKTFP